MNLNDKSKAQRVKELGVRASGQTDLLKYLGGSKLTPTRAIRAYCYECMAYYQGGRVSCELTECPLFTYMPYKEVLNE